MALDLDSLRQFRQRWSAVGDTSLWSDKTLPLVVSQVKRLQEAADSERITAAEDYEEFLLGESTGLHSRRRESDEHYEARDKLTINLCRLALNRLSKLYSLDGGPTRTYSEDPRIQAWWMDWTSRIQLDRVLQDADMWTRFHGASVLQLAWRHQGRGLDHRPLILPTLHRPWRIDVLQYEDRPAEAEAVRVFIGTRHQSGLLASAMGWQSTPSPIYQIWTADQVVRTDGGWQTKGALPNPYGFLPFVRIADRLEDFDFWTEGLAPNLVENNKSLNNLWSDLAHMLSNLFGRPVLIDPQSEPPDSWGLDIFIHVKDIGGKFMQVAPEHGIGDFINGIQKYLDIWAISIGLPSGFFQAKWDNVREVSGVAIMAAENDQTDDRYKRISLFQDVERQIVDMVSAMWYVHTGENIYPDKFVCNFPVIATSLLSMGEKRLNWGFMLDHNLVEPWKILKQAHPGLSDEQAQASVVAAQAELKARNLYEQKAQTLFSLQVLSALKPGASPTTRATVLQAIQSGDLLALDMSWFDPLLLQAALGGGSADAGAQ